MNPAQSLQDAERLLARYESEPSHPRHVAGLAGQLFDSLRKWHGRGPEAAHWLRLAALLHDIGWSQTPTGSGHHKWSAQLIESYRWQDLPPLEVAIVAQVARYHRKSLPSEKHSRYERLSPEHRRLVCELGGLLRVADALDRTHTQRVQSVSVQLTPQSIELTVNCRLSWMAERQAVAKKCDLLEIVTGRKLAIVT